MKIAGRMWLLVIALALLAPLGLIAPRVFKARGAWGEWGAEEMGRLVGYLPKGMEALASLWKSPMQGYALGNPEGKALAALSLDYIVTAVTGLVIVVLVVYITGRALIGRR